MNKNIQKLATISFLVFLVLSVAVVYWQVVRASELTARPDNPRLIDEEMRLQRGVIRDRNGKELVVNDVAENGYVKRRYLFPELAPVTGFASNRFGPSSIEKALDDYLAGRKGADPNAYINSILLHRPVVGGDVMLTIDAELQTVVEKAMGNSKGAAVVLNPKTGEVLALASHPYFDPNLLVFDPTAPKWSDESKRVEANWQSLNADTAAPLLNRVTQGLYTPGSTFKTVTLAAVLEKGIAKPDAQYKFDMKPPNADHKGLWHANQYTPCDNHPQSSTLDLTGTYAFSCNVVFSDLGLQLGPAVYQDYAKAFGLGSAPPLEIATIPSQLFHTPNYFTGQERFYALASTAFGQGELATTPLQMALIATAVANDGEIPVPHLVSAVMRQDGTVVEKAEPRVWRRAIQPETAKTMRQIMVASVDTGWASKAKIAGVKVGGKTGTAEHGTEGKPHSWFIGFAPADNPVVAIAVLKEYAGYGSDEAAPAAKTIMEAALKQFGR